MSELANMNRWNTLPAVIIQLILNDYCLDCDVNSFARTNKTHLQLAHQTYRLKTIRVFYVYPKPKFLIQFSQHPWSISQPPQTQEVPPVTPAPKSKKSQLTANTSSSRCGAEDDDLLFDDPTQLYDQGLQTERRRIQLPETVPRLLPWEWCDHPLRIGQIMKLRVLGVDYFYPKPVNQSKSQQKKRRPPERHTYWLSHLAFIPPTITSLQFRGRFQFTAVQSTTHEVWPKHLRTLDCSPGPHDLFQPSTHRPWPSTLTAMELSLTSDFTTELVLPPTLLTLKLSLYNYDRIVSLPTGLTELDCEKSLQHSSFLDWKFPSTLKRIILGQGWEEELEVKEFSLPKDLEDFHFGSWCKIPLKKMKWNNKLKNVNFGFYWGDFDKRSFEGVQFPSTLQSFDLPYLQLYSADLAYLILPAGLKHLSLNCYLPGFNNFTLPPNLESLILIGWKMNKFLPKTLRTIVLDGTETTINLTQVEWPHALEILRFGSDCPAPDLRLVRLPHTLIELDCGEQFTGPLPTTLPPNLRYLNCGALFNQPITHLQLPLALVELHLGGGFNQDLSGVTLPSGLRIFSLCSLTLNSDYYTKRLTSTFSHFTSLVRIEFPSTLSFLQLPTPPNLCGPHYRSWLSSLESRLGRISSSYSPLVSGHYLSELRSGIQYGVSTATSQDLERDAK